MPTVAGVDSSTQSCKVVVCDADTGKVLHRGRAAHPDGTEIAPAAWWRALREAGDGLLEHVDALAVAGQQHGLVALDAAGTPVRDALLWNDTRSARAAADLVDELGGPEKWAEAVGTVPVAALTVAKLRWLAEHEPEHADRTERVLLPHDWLTWHLCGGPGSGAEPVTDRGDASGTGYWSPSEGAYRRDLLALALDGRTARLPRVLGPLEAAGRTPHGALVAAGTGDNMGAALGLGIEPGDVVISLGTSGTAFAVADHPTGDPTGAVAGFADATGRYLPLVCTLNAARVLSSTARLLDVTLDDLDRLAREAEPGAGGLVLLPYLGGERTPNLPDAAGSLMGLRKANMHPPNLARAAVEGMLCNMADALDRLRDQDVEARRVLIIGGAAKAPVVGEIAAEIFGTPVTVPAPEEYVALGAARQAAWALAGTPEPPPWPVAASRRITAPADGSTGHRIRAAYAEARSTVHG
ncbi:MULTISPECIES: xylulokinase [unclassified Streptomyces]|uniref:xylulokinase n=1 Tax=unclassified Streptomyces TaxID=2593676 RepID=UPI000399E48D|nr:MULTISPECIES: xylulokinase [unclassified Streptomyces]MYT27415.1 xylulokinase [Streptomyces sp. SID8354]